MSDDPKTGDTPGGFDDWLDDEPGPVTDPYEVLASEDADEEIAEWVEFSQGSGTESDAASGEELPHEDETAEIEAIDVEEPQTHDEGDEPETSEVESVASNTEDETAEIDPVVVGEAESVDEDHDDTGELEVIESSDEELGEEHVTDELEAFDASDTERDDETDESGFGDAEDADGLEAVASIGFGELWEGGDEDDSSSSGTSPETFDMTQEDYLHTATKEHEGLAESIALADDEDTEQVALAAPIPGLDSGVVGFEDVVEAEGHGRVRARASGDLIARVITAVVLIAALGASLLWQPALVAFALAVFVLGAGEFYTALVRSGRKPIALFGFIGVGGASIGAFFGGALWIPVAFVLAVTLLLLFYAVVPGKSQPMANMALTITVMVWAGLGSFAMLIIKSDSYITLVFGVVATVAAMDIAQYFFGRALGRHKLSPWVSPKKTVEGLVAGVVVALTIGALLHFLQPFELTSGLAIGVAVAVFAPIGDLAMSAAKRSLEMKDMGSVLPGHGGFMDRIDGLLFVIPVAWAIFLWAGIL